MKRGTDDQYVEHLNFSRLIYNTAGSLIWRLAIEVFSNSKFNSQRLLDWPGFKVNMRTVAPLSFLNDI